jgi:hypothetical protein
MTRRSIEISNRDAIVATFDSSRTMAGASFLKCGKQPPCAASEVNLTRCEVCERRVCRAQMCSISGDFTCGDAIVQRLGSRFPKTRLPPMRPAGLMLNRIAGEGCPQGRLHKTCMKAPCKRVGDRNDPSRQREIALVRKLPAASVPKPLALLTSRSLRGEARNGAVGDGVGPGRGGGKGGGAERRGIDGRESEKV